MDPVESCLNGLAFFILRMYDIEIYWLILYVDCLFLHRLFLLSALQ